MAVHDRIRLTGRLQEGPRSAGPFHFGREPCGAWPVTIDPHVALTWIERVGRRPREPARDEIAVEEPLEIRVDGRALAVTMRTPGEDEELAVGFLAGEAPDRRAPPTSRSVGPDGRPRGERRRGAHRAGLRRDPAPSAASTSPPRAASAARARSSTCAWRRRPAAGARGRGRAGPGARRSRRGARRRSDAFDRTGGLHATALFAAGGELLALREDVGRHNAMDKAIGALLLAGRHRCRARSPASAGGSASSWSRRPRWRGLAGIVAVGAPTSLAVELAAGARHAAVRLRARRDASTSTRAPTSSAADRAPEGYRRRPCRLESRAMEVLAFLIPFVLLGAAVVFIAFSGGPGAAREAYLTRGGAAFQSRSRSLYVVARPGRARRWSSPTADEAAGGTGALQDEELTESEKHGKILFRQRCASCHTLAAVNARGVTGPNLDRIGKVTPERVIRPPSASAAPARSGCRPACSRARRRRTSPSTSRASPAELARRGHRVPCGKSGAVRDFPRRRRLLQCPPSIQPRPRSGRGGTKRPRGQGRIAGDGVAQLFQREPVS